LRQRNGINDDLCTVAVAANVAIERHRLHRAEEPFGVGRDDLFLAGDQGDVAHAFLGDHAVVVLTRQRTEREAGDAGGMGEQPLDGKMRLAGVRRTEDGLYAHGKTGVGRAGTGRRTN